MAAAAPTSDPAFLRKSSETCVNNAKAALEALAPPTQFAAKMEPGNYEGDFKFELQHGLPGVTAITDFLKNYIDHSTENANHYESRNDGKALASLFRSYATAVASVQATLIGKERTNNGVVSVEAVAKMLLGLLDGRSQNMIPKYTFDDTHTLVKTADSLTSDVFSRKVRMSRPVEQKINDSKMALPISREKMVEREKEIVEVIAQQTQLEAQLAVEIQRQLEAMLNDARAAAEDSKVIDTKRTAANAAHQKDNTTYERIKKNLGQNLQAARTERKGAEDRIESHLAQILKLLAEIPPLKETVAQNAQKEDKATKDLDALEKAHAESEKKYGNYMKRLDDRTSGNSALQKATKDLQDSTAALLKEITKYDGEWRHHAAIVLEHVGGLICYHDQVEHGLYSLGVSTHGSLISAKSTEAENLDAEIDLANDHGQVDVVTAKEAQLEQLRGELEGLKREHTDRSVVVKGLDDRYQKSREGYEAVCVGNGRARAPAAAASSPAPAAAAKAPAPAAAAKKAKAPAAAAVCEEKASCDDPPAYTETDPAARVLEYEGFRVTIEAPAIVWRRRQAMPRKPTRDPVIGISGGKASQ